MLREISWKQFIEWIAYYEAEPFGYEYDEVRDRRDSYRIASIVTMLANVNRDHKKRREPYKIEDFLLEFSSEPKKKRSTQDLLMVAKMWVSAFGGSQPKKGL